MSSISILIKPASNACNMDCSYCFYKDVSQNRTVPFSGLMTNEIAETVIARAFEFADESCTFIFQGGEPTLAGLDFFKHFIATEAKYASKNIKIFHAIQTNGYQINDNWAKFFKENKFLVGLSLDGIQADHNIYRRDMCGKETFDKVMHTVRIFNKYAVDYNILSVVTEESALNIEKTYDFFKEKNFNYIQFIPCLDPLSAIHSGTKCYLSTQTYGEFLIKIFRLWFADLTNGRYISIRHIDNYIGILAGIAPEACNMNGCCTIQFVIEGNGNVYPCDFYALDKKYIGNVVDVSFNEMLNSVIAKNFIAESFTIPIECKKCRFYPLCRNGCKRERLLTDNKYEKNCYCEAFKMFFTECGNELVYAMKMLYGN